MDNIKLNEFEGPLDVLLHLIKKSNIEIKDIVISEITDQYLEFIHNIKDNDLDLSSEYLVMAAELIELKSRSLLPITVVEEEMEDEEITKEKLIKKLIEYEKYKELTTQFKNLELTRKMYIVKEPENLSIYAKEEEIIKQDINILVNAFNNYLTNRKEKEPLHTKIAYKEFSIDDRIIEIKELLEKYKKMNFFDLFDTTDNYYIVITFLSILTLSKRGIILIEQNANFDEIFIELRK